MARRRVSDLRRHGLTAALVVAAAAAPAAAPIIIDNDQPGFTILSGAWALSSQGATYGPHKRYLAPAATPTGRVRWRFADLIPGRYEVTFWVNDNNYVNDARYTIAGATETRAVTASQQFVGDGWHTLGEFMLGMSATVELTNQSSGTGLFVIADAVRLLPRGGFPDAYEPNDTPERATPLLLNEAQTHSLIPAGDQDWFRFVSAATRAVTLEAVGAANRTFLWLYDETMRLTAFDHASGPGGTSRLALPALGPGTYYALVDEPGLDDELAAYTIRLTATEQGKIAPYITIVIDDFGNQNPLGTNATSAMLSLPPSFAFTAAVLPRLPFTDHVVAAWQAAGREHILHQPMEPLGYPSVNPGPGAILLSTPDAEARAILAANLAEVRGSAGVNNHTGSALTQNAAKMELICNELAARGLLFFDSWTIGTSVAYRTAQAAGLPAGVNARFLDGGSTSEAVSLITSLATNARDYPNLAHIGIGHARDSTARALEQMGPILASMGVGTRTLSHSVAIVIEVDRVPAGMAFARSGNWQPTGADAVFSLYAGRSETTDGIAYRVLDCAASGVDSATFTPRLTRTGAYDVYLLAPGGADNCSRVDVAVHTLHGVERLRWDQRAMPGMWYYLGRFDLAEGAGAHVVLDDFDAATPNETFYADAVKFVRAGEAALPRAAAALEMY